jgi:hypothetical protein
MQCAGQLFLALTGQVDAGAAGQQAADGGGGVPPGATGDVQPYGRHPARKSLLQPCSLLQKPPLHLLQLINRRAPLLRCGCSPARPTLEGMAVHLQARSR